MDVLYSCHLVQQSRVHRPSGAHIKRPAISCCYVPWYTLQYQAAGTCSHGRVARVMLLHHPSYPIIICCLCCCSPVSVLICRPLSTVSSHCQLPLLLLLQEYNHYRLPVVVSTTSQLTSSRNNKRKKTMLYLFL